MEAHVTAGSPTGDPPASPTLVVAPGDPKPDAEPDKGFVLRIKGKEYDATDLTLNEGEQVEDLCGDTSLEFLDLGRPKTLHAIVHVLLKRDDPDITWEQSGELKMRGILGADEK